MNFLLYERTRMGISQSKMAGLLGCSKSMIYHVEKGNKHFSSKFMIKLGHIIARFERLYSAGLNAEPVLTGKDREYKKARLSEVRHRREILVRDVKIDMYKLEKVRRKYQQCLSQQFLNQAVAENIKDGSPGKGDHLWLAVNIIDTEAALKQCSPEVQDKMVAKIEKMKGEILVMDDYIRKHTLCIELPVRLKEAG